MKRILVVEDNRLERKLVMNLLQKHFNNDIITDEASTGSEAVQLLSKLSYDLVITDLVMPGKIEGIQLIRTVIEEYPLIRIIAISGSKPYYLYMAKKLGAEAVFTKPLVNEKIIEIINYLLN